VPSVPVNVGLAELGERRGREPLHLDAPVSERDYRDMEAVA
jgi:hypothetical protein